MIQFQKKYLKLSIRHQISLSIILLYFIFTITTLLLFIIYSFIILGNQTKKIKKFYYTIFKDTIDSKIKFQNFLLFQYEQLIKSFNNQVFYYGKSLTDLYETLINFKSSVIIEYTPDNEWEYDPDADDDEKLYFLKYFTDDVYMNNLVYYMLANTYLSIDNQLKAIRNFRIPLFGNDEPIINEYIFVPLSKKALYSINRTRIKELEELTNGNYSNYYENLINKYVTKYKKFFNDYKNGNLLFYDLLYKSKFFLLKNYADEDYIKKYFNSNALNYINNVSQYFNFIDYSSERTFLTDNGDRTKVNFLDENTIINNYLDFIFINLLVNVDINNIPIFPENSKIMSVNLCYAFLLKQIIYLNLSDEYHFNKQELDDIYSKLKKGVSNISDCILDKKYSIKNNHNAYDYINIKFLTFYNIKNRREFSIFKLSNAKLGSLFYNNKYTFPDYNSIIDFKPDYLTLDQINLYSFITYYEPYYYFSRYSIICDYILFFIIICNLYIWAIILLYLICKTKTICREVLDPINNLSDMLLNNTDIKSNKKLVYECDDCLNELFVLISNLLNEGNKQEIFTQYKNKNERRKRKKIEYNNNLLLNQKIIENLIENKKKDSNNKLSNNIIIFKRNNFYEENKDREKNYRESRRVRSSNKESNENKNNNKDNKENTIKSKLLQINSLHEKKYFFCQKKLLFDKRSSCKNNIDEDDENIRDDYYVSLYELTDLMYNWEFKNNKLISKIHNLGCNYFNNKKVIFSPGNTSDINNNNNSINNSNNIGRDISRDIFYKNACQSYRTKNLLFLWYAEAKYFRKINLLNKDFNKHFNNDNIESNEDSSKDEDNKRINERKSLVNSNKQNI